MNILTVLLASLSVINGAASKYEEPPLEPEYVSLIASRFSEDAYRNEDKLELILSGKFTLTTVIMSSDDDIFGTFCEFDFESQKVDPSLVSRFIDLHQTLHCHDHVVMLPLLDVSKAARIRDKHRRSHIKSMTPNAFIFHQPKSGSTLLTNMIVASQPGSRIIADAYPLENFLTCAECSHEAKKHALQEAVYMLGRTIDHDVTRFFVKFTAPSTTGIHVVRDAFPDVKWLFVHREHDAILQKLMNKRVERLNCDTKHRRNPGTEVTDFLSTQNKQIDDLHTPEQVCAAVLATYMDKVLKEIVKPNSHGLMVDYDQDLLQEGGLRQIFKFLGISPNWERIEEQRNKYAVGGHTWHGEPELAVTNEVHDAVLEFSVVNVM